MHFVDRGSEPDGLKKYRGKYTPKWVKYYQYGKGRKPSDSYWREFHAELAEAFSGLCGYCEAQCKGEVDHFRPKSRFPARVYEWLNWVLSCHDCNNSKSEKWPEKGYVDPCARTRPLRPERFFGFDLKTGEIYPKPGLTGGRWQRARTMIEDLKLNAFHHLKRRLRWIRVVETVLASESETDSGHQGFVQRVSARDWPFSSITRAFLVEQGHLVDDI